MAKLPLDPAVLAEMARNNVSTIARIWSESIGNLVRVFNQIRALFNLSSQAEAVELYNQSLGYSKTSAGQAALGQRAIFDPWDTPIVPELRSPFGDYGQFRYVVSFMFGDEWFSFIEWNNKAPTTNEIGESIAQYIRDQIDVYPILARIMQTGVHNPTDITVRGAVRRY